MVTRTINNTGTPFMLANGTPAAGVQVTAQLIVDMAAGAVIDAISGETVCSTLIKTNCDSNGLCSLSLWPTSRGNLQSAYLVTIHTPVPATFVAALPQADLSALPWDQFILQGQPLTPIPTDAITLLSNRITALETLVAGFLSHCSSPYDVPLWDGGPWPGGSAYPTAICVADSSNGQNYNIIVVNGLLQTVPLETGAGTPLAVIIADLNNNYYQVSTINGGLATTDGATGPVQNNIIADSVTGEAYQIIIKDGVIDTEPT